MRSRRWVWSISSLCAWRSFHSSVEERAPSRHPSRRARRGRRSRREPSRRRCGRRTSLREVGRRGGGEEAKRQRRGTRIEDADVRFIYSFSRRGDAGRDGARGDGRSRGARDERARRRLRRRSHDRAIRSRTAAGVRPIGRMKPRGNLCVAVRIASGGRRGGVDGWWDRFGDALYDRRRTGAAAESADICRRGVRVGSLRGDLRNISFGGTRRGQIAEQSRGTPFPSPERGCC